MPLVVFYIHPMKHNPNICAAPIRPYDIPQVMQDCRTAKTWKPHALGIFGTQDGHILVERKPGGALKLPSKGIYKNGSPLEAFAPQIPADIVSPTSVAIYDMYEPYEGFDRYTNGSLFLLLKQQYLKLLAKPLQSLQKYQQPI